MGYNLELYLDFYRQGTLLVLRGSGGSAVHYCTRLDPRCYYFRLVLVCIGLKILHPRVEGVIEHVPVQVLYHKILFYRGPLQSGAVEAAHNRYVWL